MGKAKVHSFLADLATGLASGLRVVIGISLIVVAVFAFALFVAAMSFVSTLYSDYTRLTSSKNTQ